MTVLKFVAHGKFTDFQQLVLTRAVRSIPNVTITTERVSKGGKGVLGFGIESEVTTLAPKYISSLPTAERIIARDIRTLLGLPAAPLRMPKPRGWDSPTDPKVLYFDIESHSSDDLWRMKPHEFFRLGQYRWGTTGAVTLTEDLDELREQILAADLVVGHNIHQFDLTAVFGKDSTIPLELARDGKVFDTFVFAQLALPAPSRYINTNGRMVKCSSPPEIMKWLSLDNLAHQLDVTGKIGDLKALAKEFGGFGNIPTTDQRFRVYAEQDVVALTEVCSELLDLREVEDYDWREQTFAGICAQNSRNGWKVDINAAIARRDELAQRKEDLMNFLVENYNFPTAGKQPWRSNEGKAAIFKILEDNGITLETRPDWERTATGNLSLGGDVIKELTAETPAEELGESLAELMGQRSLSQLTLDSVQPDGRVHPSITSLQRSGRLSTTKPGLTVWSSRDKKKSVEKAYYIPDHEDHSLMGFDFSNADARIVAAYSGDTEYAKRFIPDPVTGVVPDGHILNAYLVFGEKVANKDLPYYRGQVKACISEGQRVKTDKGLVPIEDVTLDHKVWDGIEWVSHEGLLDKGEREVITYDGLTATPDHKVFVRRNGVHVMPFGRAKELGLPLYRPQRTRKTVRPVKRRRLPSLKVQRVANRQRTVRVYDLLNAGARHRFTVQGAIISNCAHAWNYGGGAAAICRASKMITMDIAEKFVRAMNKSFPALINWQNKVRREGKSGMVVNDWGRPMLVDIGKEFTQAPALYGQSGTRELMVDGLIRLLHADMSIILMLKAQIHDEVLFSIPNDRLGTVPDTIVKTMETEWEPKNSKGLKIPFPVAHSEPAENWQKAGDH